MASPLTGVGLSVFSSFGCMAIGVLVCRAGILSDDARKGVATLYAKLVFPTMVFMGVADIDVAAIDRSLLLVIFAAKATLAAMIVAYATLMVRPSDAKGALAHAGALAMAASHSFDVTMGVPLAKVLHPQSVAYVYLNQSVQLVLVNPVLLVLMELGASSTAGSAGNARRSVPSRVLAAFGGVATNPLVVMTVLGLVAGQVFPGGLPAPLAVLGKQVASAGPFLGFLALGFALAGLGHTAGADLGHAAALCCAKLVGMPLLYAAVARVVQCEASDELLSFLGGLPASASVYSLCLTKGLSPRIVGPLVPGSILLCVALALLPLWPTSAAVRAADGLRGLIAVGGMVGARVAMRSRPHSD